MKTIEEIYNEAASFREAVELWHVEKGGSLDDTTNPISWCESEGQVAALWKRRMDEHQKNMTHLEWDQEEIDSWKW